MECNAARYCTVLRGSRKGEAEAMGSRSILEDLGIARKIRLSEDSSAAKGIADRTGLGKVRHIEVNQLWIQEKVKNKEFEIRRVKGLDNLADALTKHVDGEDVQKQLLAHGPGAN